MSRVYFKASSDAMSAVTEVHDFIWPTAAALWNLRWQVAGYLSAHADATITDLDDKFAWKDGPASLNLKKTCFDTTWESQQEQFARFLLGQLCGIYESYLSGILKSLSIHNDTILKKLQFTTEGNVKGIWPAINHINLTESSAIRSSFYPGLITHKWYSKNELDDLLKCYRYFKECRNCLFHNGGIASDKAETSYLEFSQVTKTDLKQKEIPKHEPLRKGDLIKIHFRGVVLLSSILLRMIVTIDAELAKSSRAESELKSRWLEEYGKTRIYLGSDVEKRKGKIRGRLKTLQFGTICHSRELETLLQDWNFID